MEEQIRNYQRILKTNPTDVPAFTALEEIYQGKDRWRDLVTLYEDRARVLVDADAARAVREKCAAIYHHKMGDLAKATVCYEGILRTQSDHRAALQGLADIFSRRNEWPKLAEVLERLAALAAEPEERARLFARLGVLYRDTLKRRDKALVAFGHALRASERQPEVYAALRELYTELGWFERAHELLEREAAAFPENAEGMARAFLSFGEALLEEPLFSDTCQKVLEKARSLLPQPGPAEEALRKLEAIRSDWKARVKALRVEAIEAPDKTRAVHLYRQIAELAFIHGGSDAEIEENLGKCVLLQPGNPRLLLFMERYYLERKRTKELLDRLGDMAGKVKDRRVAILILERLAMLSVVHLQDRKTSIETYRRMLQLEPDNPSAVSCLIETYQEEGRWAEVVDLLKGQVERQTDPVQRADLLFQIARVTMEQLRDPQAAALLYEEILRLSPQNLAAAQSLGKIYEKKGEPEALVRCLEIELAHAREKKETLRLLDRLIELHRDERKEAGRAFETVLRALQVDPSRKKTLKEALSLAEATGRFQDLAAAMRSVLDAHGLSGKHRLEMLGMLAAIAETRLDNAQEAIRAYQEILAEDGKNLSALEALERLQKESGGSVELVGIYQRQLELVTGKEKRRELLFKLADIFQNRMADFGRAAETCRQILELDPRDADAWLHLADLEERESRWENAAKALERVVSLLADPAAIQRVKVRLAGIYEQRLGDTERALQICNEVLSSDHLENELAPATVGILERLQGRGVSPLRIAEILQPYYALAGDWRRHIDMLEVRLEGSSSVEERVRLYQRIAQVYEEELAQPEAAFSAYIRAFMENPERPELLEALLRLAQDVGRQEALAAALESVLQKVKEPDFEIRINRMLGQLYRERLNRSANAVAAYRRILERMPGDESALAALSDVFRAERRFDELSAVLRSRLQSVADAAARVPLLRELGDITDAELHDRPAAIECFSTLRELVPDDVEVLRRLDGLLEKEGRWPDLARVLEEEIRLLPAEASELELRLGRVRAERMEERRHAVADYQKVLAERPDDPRAIEGLEALLGRPDSAPLAAASLIPIYERKNEWAKLAAALEIRAESLEDAADRVRVWLRTAEIFERQLGQQDRAISALRRAFRADPGRQDVLANLERLADKAGAPEELAGAIEESLTRELPPDRMVFFLQHLARIYRDKLRRPDLAATSLRRLLDVDPQNGAALASLEAYYREYKAFQDLAWVLARQAELAARPEERGDLLTQVAQIREEQLSDMEGAIQAFQQVLTVNPDDLATLRQLDRLYQATGRWEDDARLLPRLCELSKNAAAVVEYLSRLAAIYAERLSDPRQAVVINARVLELKPAHPEAVAALEGLLRDERARMAAAEVLEGVYRQASEWRKLAGILELHLAATADAANRLELHARLREIYEQKIGEKALAFNVTARAFREVPQDEGVRRELLRQAVESGFFEELLQVFQDAADRLVGTDLSFDLRKQIARILEQNLNRRAEAVQSWEKLLSVRENDAEVLEALERLYREDGNFQALVEIYRRQVQFSEDPARRKDLLFQMAACLSEGVQDLGAAVDVYRQILDLDPGDRRALKLLEQLLAVGGRWPEVAAALQAQLDLLGGVGEAAPDVAGRVDLLLRLGKVRFEYLHDGPGAVAAAQEAVQLLPGEPRVVEFLERLLGTEPTRGEAARLLEPSYRASGDFKKLVAVLEVHLAARRESRERLQVFRQIMQLYEGELKQKPMAFAVAVRAFRENVADEGIRADLERLAQETGSFEELAGVYEEAVSSAQGTATGAILARRLAQLTESHLHAKDEAVSHWRQVLSADPDDLEALRALERLFRERGAFQELVGVLRHLAELEKNPEKRKDLYLEVAGLMEERLGHNDGAIEAYREILAEDANDMAVVKLLDRLLERQGRFEELAEVLRFELERSPESELLPLFLRLARLQRYHLGKPELAVASLGEVLQRQASHPEALSELCAMFDSGEVRPLAARLMAEHLEATGDHAHLAQALDVLADVSEDAAERKRHLLRLAALWDRRLGRKDQAFAALGRAFSEDPTDEKVRLGLERLAEDLGDWNGLAAFYASRLEGLEDKHIELILHRRLAGLYGERLQNPEQALVHLQAVSALDAKDSASLLALEAIYRQQNQFDALIEVLRKRSKLSPNLEQAAAVLYEVAGIQEEKLGDPGGAIQTFREIAQLQPRDINALRMIDRLCQQQARLKELAEVIVAEIKLLDSLGDRAESLDLRFRLARLYEQEFGDLKRAGILYRDILQADPAHSKTIEHLESLQAEGRLFEGAAGLLEVAYERTGNWKKYVDILEQQVRQSRVMARRVELLQKMAQVQEQRLNLKSLAFNTWVRVFHEDLGSITAREQLERLAAEEENLEALAAVYEEELDNIEDAVVGAAVALKLAEIHTQTGGEWEDIVRFYKVATRFDGRNRAAWSALEGLYAQHERYDEQVEALSRLVDLAGEAREQSDILFRLGSVLQDKLQNSARAVGYFRRVLDLSPGHLDSLRALERAFAEQGNHEALFDTLKAHLESAQDADERAELEARIADLAAGPLNRPDDAIALWQKVLQADPRNREAFQALDQLFEKAGRWAELSAHIESGMRSTNDPERIAALSSRLGWVKGEKLGELEEAMKNWQEVLRLDPKNQGALQALRGLYTSSGQWDLLLQVLRKLVPLQEDMLGVKQLRFQMAEILGEKLNRGAEAIEAAKRAQDIEPHTSEELERLGRIFQANEAWSDAVAVLEQAADLKTVPADRIQALLDVAALWKERIGRPLGAAPAYEKVLEIDPSHDEAFRAVQDIYQAGKEWRRLAALLEKRQAAIRERKDRVVLMKTIAEIYERHLGQKPIAFARYCAAFREDVGDDEVLTKLELLADEIEDYDTLLEVLEYATSEVGGGSRAVKLYQKIASIHRSRLNQPEQAEAFLRKAISLDRRDVSSLDALAELYRDADRIGDLIQALESKYDRSDTLEARKDILHQIARLQEERLSRIDLAVDTLKRVLELDGRDTPAIQNLIRLYQQEAKWKELIQILRRAADQADERAVTVNYLANIASIYETELQDDEQAIRAYQAVLEFEQSHLESLKALERLFTRLDRFSELLPVFEQQVQLVPERDEKIKILSKMGTIYEERFGNAETASACFDRILELDPANLPAVKAQERLVRRLGDFNRLIDLYYRHIQLTDDRNEQVEIHLAIGDVWYRELSRVDKAEEVYAKALGIDPRSRPAIHALGQLYEKSGNWFNAIEMLSKEAELCGATPEAVDLYYRQGKINEDMLLDSQAAREAYSHALAIDPAYLPAIKALKLIYYLDKEYDRYLEMMSQEAEYTEDIEEKTRLYFEIGKFVQDQGEDTARAAQAYEEALRLTANYLPAAKPLADIYFRTEQWERAETMMEVVVAGLDRNTESKELCRQYYRLGYITEKLGKEDRALEHYRTSYELDATYLPALEGLGNALLKAEKWEEAYRIYQTILIHHRNSLSDAEVAEIHWQIGDVNYRMGELDRAQASFKKALEIDAGHLASLQYLFRIAEERQSWEEAYDFGTQMIDSLDGEELYEHYLRLAALCREKLQDPFRAVDALLGAARAQPESLEPQTQLLALYTETRQFPKAVECLERIIQIEARPRLLVGYHQQAGQLLRDELRDDLRAVEHFNAALDLDPSAVQAFQAVVEILTRRKDWLQLRDNYIKMVKRLPVEARKTKLALWKDLGELCRVVLRNLNEAIDAYRMIVTLDPEEVNSLATLGDLLAAKQGATDEAIAVHHRVLAASAERVASYRTLWKLYNNRKDYDKVYVLASILRYLKKADDEENKIVAYFSKKAPELAGRAINDKLWEEYLAHPGVKVPFTRIFGLLYRVAPAMFLREHKDVGLNRREHQIDLARDRSLVAHNFRLAAKALGGPEVELFALKDQEAPHLPGIALALTRPTAVIAYRDVFREDKKKHLLFYIGRQLSMVRPEFILACALPLSRLNDLLQAVCLHVDPRYKAEGDPKEIERARAGLKRALREDGAAMLQRAVADYLKNPRAFSLKNWLEAVEHSVNRCGFVVCNDIPTAMGILKNEPAGITPMRPIQKIRELLVFMSSPQYLKLREVLALAVGS